MNILLVRYLRKLVSMFKHGKPPRIRGWVNVRTKGHMRAQPRYARLVTHKLTLYDAAEDDAAPLTSVSLSGATVADSPRRREIAITIPTGERHVLSIRSDNQFRAWNEACRVACQTIHNHYVIVDSRIIGTGAFSNVFFGFDRETGDHAAIKVMEKTGRTMAELSYTATEARVLSFALHPNIVRCIDIFDADNNLYIVMHHMTGGTLSQRLASADPVTRSVLFYDSPDAFFVAATRKNYHALFAEHPALKLQQRNHMPNGKSSSSSSSSTSRSQARHELNVAAWRRSVTREGYKDATRFHTPTIAVIMRNILSALAYLHENGVVHRDLKPDNILLSGDPDPVRWAASACVSDFGLAAYITSDDRLSGVVGTPNFVAPEMLRRDENKDFVGYGPQVDIWAVGVLLHWLLSGGQLPFDGDDPVSVYAVIRAVTPQTLTFTGGVWDTVSAPAKNLLRGLLNPEPTCRLSAFGALAHPYLTLSTGFHFMTRKDLAEFVSTEDGVAPSDDNTSQDTEPGTSTFDTLSEERMYGIAAYLDDEYGHCAGNGRAYSGSNGSAVTMYKGIGNAHDPNIEGRGDLAMRALSAMLAASSPVWRLASPLGKFRAAANTVVAMARLKETLKPKSRRRLVTFGLPEHMRRNRLARMKISKIDKPPVGIDGLRYNVGLLGPRRSILTDRSSSNRTDRGQFSSRSSTSSQKQKSAAYSDPGTPKSGSKSSGHSVRRISRGSNGSEKVSTSSVSKGPSSTA